jgi:hypothetical protein
LSGKLLSQDLPNANIVHEPFHRPMQPSTTRNPADEVSADAFLYREYLPGGGSL